MTDTDGEEFQTLEGFGNDGGTNLCRFPELQYEAISPPNAPGRISPDAVVSFGRPSKEQREIIFSALGNTSGEYIPMHFSRLIRFAMPLETWEGDYPVISEPRVRLSTYNGSSYCHLADHDHPHGGVRSPKNRLNTQQIIEQSKRLLIVPQDYEREYIEGHFWEVSSLLKALNWEGDLQLFENGQFEKLTIEDIDSKIGEKTLNSIYFTNLYQVNMRGLMKLAIERVRRSLPDGYANGFQMKAWQERNAIFNDKKEIDTTALSESYIGRTPLPLQLLYAVRRNFGIPYASLKVKDRVFRREFFPLLDTDEDHKTSTWRGTGEYEPVRNGALHFRGMWSSFAKRGFFDEFDGELTLSAAADRLLTLLGPELEDVDLPGKLVPYFNGDKSKKESEQWITEYAEKVKLQLSRRYTEL
jgi:hypothetical protein